jgi:hypothetical protein
MCQIYGIFLSVRLSVLHQRCTVYNVLCCYVCVEQIKNGRLMDAHALMKSATTSFLVAVRAQSRVDTGMVTIVIGHISSAIRRVALSFDTPPIIRDEYVNLLKEWKRLHSNYDFGENYVEWTSDGVSRVMRGDEVAIRAFNEPLRVADDRIAALTVNNNKPMTQ